jgi:hypothetical protein
MVTSIKRDSERDGEHGKGSLAFSVTKPVVLHLLDEEITKAHGWRKDSGLVAEGDPASASEDSPVTVWVLRADAETNTVRKAVTAHQGVEDVSDEVAPLRAKAQSGEDLSADEMQVAIRLLLTRG